MPAVRRHLASEMEIAAALRGEPAAPSDPAAFADMALHHRVAPLLVHAHAASRLPGIDAARLLTHAREEIVVSELRDRQLCRALCALRDDGVEALLMKGSHLAYSHYAASHLRPRDDTDLLVSVAQRDRAAEILARAGYERMPDLTGGLVLGQTAFTLPDTVGALLDVHWHIVARRLVAGALTFEDMWKRSVALPRLGPCARGPCAVDALALAAIHQSAHHAEHDLLLWVYDTHLLATRLSDEEVHEFVALAAGRGIVALAVYSIELLMHNFPSPQAQALLDALRRVQRREPAAFLVERRTALENLASDLAALKSWRARAHLLAAHLFPPAAYMRHTYRVKHRVALPWFYLRRIVGGTWRWVRERRD